MNKQQKVALVTGASSGIGKEIAKQLSSDGYIVYGAARRVEKMKDLESLGVRVLKMDITREEDIQNAVATIESEHAGIDVLVNNAGFGMFGAMEDTSLEDARYQFEVNIFGLAALTKTALPYMRSKRSGKIINISSIGGKIFSPLGSWYHATKHALEGWSDCLRFELEPFGIDVIIIEPGAIKTEFGDVMAPPMLERSGQSAYSEMATKLAALSKKEYDDGGGSPPTVISDVVSKALRSNKPRTRYAAGKYAGPMLFIRKWFSDRAFDSVLKLMLR